MLRYNFDALQRRARCAECCDAKSVRVATGEGSRTDQPAKRRATRMSATPNRLTRYDDAPLSRFHLRVGIASVGGVFADGFGLGIIGIALSLAGPKLALDPLWLGLLGGGSLAGLFIGALVTGPFADRHGRRPVYSCNMLVATALSAAQFLVSSGTELLLLRIGIGFVLGTDYVVSKTLLTEFVPVAYRGRILSLLSVAWAGGYACAYAVGVELSQFGAEAWRWMLLASAVPCVLIAPLRLTMPESPLWLVRHGFDARAAAVVREKFGAGVQPPQRGDGAARRPGRWAELFSARWRVRTLVGATFFTCQVIPYFALGTFVTQVMAALHISGGSAGGLIYNFALFAGAVIGVFSIDRMPRRRFLIGSFALAAAAMLALGASHDAPAWLMILFFALFAGVVSAASNLVYVYLPELFPTTLRASGIGLAVAASRVGSAAGTFVLPLVLVRFGARTALGVCFIVLLIGLLVCWRCAPETRNLGLEALDREPDGAGEQTTGAA
jgi:MFS transporter, putative metabolite transport protein